MNNGECFSFAGDNIYYGWPDLTCSDGDILQLSSAITRETYYKNGSRLVKVRQESITDDSLNGLVLYQYSSGKVGYDLATYILPCTIFVIAFFAIIYRWFFRLRA